MKFKLLFNLVIFVSLFIGFLTPADIASAHVTGTCTGGQDCYNKDADHTTKNGIYCSNGAVTVLYNGGSGRTSAGANGTVKVELRWSSHCTANWSRATLVIANGSSRQLGAKANPTTGFYKTRYIHAMGGVIPAGAQTYTYMVNGSVVVTASAGINNAVCSGNPAGTGFPCSYNPLVSYSG